MCVILYYICSRCLNGHPRFTEICGLMHPPLINCPQSTQFKFHIVNPELCSLHPHHASLPHLGRGSEDADVFANLSRTRHAVGPTGQRRFVGAKGVANMLDYSMTFSMASDESSALAQAYYYGWEAGNKEKSTYQRDEATGLVPYRERWPARRGPINVSRSQWKRGMKTNKKPDRRGCNRRKGGKSTKSKRRGTQQAPQQSFSGYSMDGVQNHQDTDAFGYQYSAIQEAENQCQKYYGPRSYYGGYIRRQSTNRPYQGDTHSAASGQTHHGATYGNAAGSTQYHPVGRGNTYRSSFNPLATEFKTQAQQDKELEREEQMARLQQLQNSHEADAAYDFDYGDSNLTQTPSKTAMMDSHGSDGEGGASVVYSIQAETPRNSDAGLDAAGTENAYSSLRHRRWSESCVKGLGMSHELLPSQISDDTQVNLAIQEQRDVSQQEHIDGAYRVGNLVQPGARNIGIAGLARCEESHPAADEDESEDRHSVLDAVPVPPNSPASGIPIRKAQPLKTLAVKDALLKVVPQVVQAKPDTLALQDAATWPALGVQNAGPPRPSTPVDKAMASQLAAIPKITTITTGAQVSPDKSGNDTTAAPKDSAAAKTWASLFRREPRLTGPSISELSKPHTQLESKESTLLLTIEGPKTPQRAEAFSPPGGSALNNLPSNPPNSPVAKGRLPSGGAGFGELRSIADHGLAMDMVLMGAFTPAPTTISTPGGAETVSMESGDSDAGQDKNAEELQTAQPATKPVLSPAPEPALPTAQLLEPASSSGPRLWSQILGGSDAQRPTAATRPTDTSGNAKGKTDWPSLAESGTQPKRKR